MRPLYAVLTGSIAMALVAAGCSGAIPSSDGGSAALKLMSSNGRNVLVDGYGSNGVDTGSLGTIKRDDGDIQVTYHGHPLYFYAADASTPGKTKGEDLTQFGAPWYLVDAAGKPVEARSGSHSKSNSSSGSNSRGGGY